MTSARITRPRRLFVDALTSTGKTTFSELRKILVGSGSGKMDLTTLYRVVDVFVKQGLIHQIDKDGEKIIFFAEENFNPTTHSSEIIVCENCGHINTKYEKLPEWYLNKTAISHIHQCEQCA